MKREILIAGTFREDKRVKKLIERRRLSKEEAEEIFMAKDFTRFLPADNERRKGSCLNSL